MYLKSWRIIPLKAVTFFILIYFSSGISLAQLIQAKNEIKDSLREGLWNEIEIKTILDIKGESHIVFDLHYAPEYILSEGYYVKGNKHGVWKNFFIERYNDSGNVKYRKGQLKDLCEFEEGYLSGIFVSYFKNGQVRILGQYCIFKQYSLDTLEIPINCSDDYEQKVFESFYKSEMTGNWYEFEQSGKIKELKNYGKHEECLKNHQISPKSNSILQSSSSSNE